MTISDLSSLTNLTSESCILVRKGGVDYQYTISQLVDELLVNPSADVSVSPILGTKSNPYSSAFIKDLTVSGSITLPDGALDGIINNCGDDVSLIVDKTDKSIKHRVYGETPCSSTYFSTGLANPTATATWNLGTDDNGKDILKDEILYWAMENPKFIEKGLDDTGNIKTYNWGLMNFGGKKLLTTTNYACDVGIPGIFFDNRGHIVKYSWKDLQNLCAGQVTTSILGVGPNLQGDETFTTSRYFMTVDDTGNIIAPSLVLMADTTADLTDYKINPLADTVSALTVGGRDENFILGYLPNVECMIAGAPKSKTYLDSQGYLLTVTGGIRVGRTEETYKKLWGQDSSGANMEGEYNLSAVYIDKNGLIQSNCGYKCYGNYKYATDEKDSEGNVVMALSEDEAFLNIDGTKLTIGEEETYESYYTLLGCAIHATGSIVSGSPIMGSRVFNAVWNDLADCIPVNKEAVIEPGYCYCFDGEKYYKSTKYLEKGIIGIESDTYGMHMGSKPGVKQMDVAVSGFALAYVDKEYESGTPLTCTENGYLTEIAKQDKIEYPERIVGTYWKPEPNEEWGSSDRKVKVKGRHWIKIK